MLAFWGGVVESLHRVSGLMHYPYKNDKVAQAYDMVVTSLYTRNMLSTTLFPGRYNLVKPGDKLVSLHKVDKLSQDHPTQL